ncbi:HlyD family efflux transporter periplasmic adaptor subunit [Thiotrichales bacterium 19S3-7]|nr:HlyD family efflux transporter periplasmic adaptor subunit [Thiotrichales bacterium 19S3-7]MCF6802435.1 HlyD family efflux transporter periplasmic adaptor subunit [Thiotrichales bacterium 19S3-11]
MSEALATLISLEHNARQTQSIDELAFFIVHNAREMFAYDKAVVWRSRGTFRITPKAISRISQVDKYSPFAQWVSSIIKHVIKKNKNNQKAIWTVSIEDVPETLQEGWPEHVSKHLLVCPFKTDYGEVDGGCVFSVEKLPEEEEEKRIEWLVRALNYYWQALCQKSKFSGHWFRWKKRYTWSVVIAVILLMFFPVSQSTIAPATVVAKEPLVITSPMDGVIESFDIKPNQMIEKGTALFRIDDRDLKNANELAEKELLTTKAKYLKAVQTGFKDIKNRAEINILKAEMAEKQLEVEYTEKLLNESIIKSPETGIAIIDEINDWIGKPVVTGEKVMEVARKGEVELEVWLPVSDALGFKSDDDVVLFLNAKPLHAIDARIRYVSFNAKMTPQQVLAYRVVADFTTDETLPEIGSQGSAKLVGGKVTLFFYLFRRPITVLRQNIGW